MKKPVRTEGVFFDLDGTLIDTAPDMGGALNRMLAAHGRAPIDPADYRHLVSDGSRALTRLGFGPPRDDAEQAARVAEFLHHYSACLADESVLFPGMASLLDALDARGVVVGIVTNKPGAFTEPLLQQMGLRERFASVVSSDTIAKRKPDPDPIWHAAEESDVDPAACVYVGDAERDIIAGRAAGMRTLAVSWGYFPASTRLADWQPDAIVDTPAAIIDHLVD
ncbi:MAG: phosphoglycolate phosphatase [Pseudomonadota bacterium]